MASTVKLEGGVTVGGVLSTTVTVNEPLAALPAASVAEQTRSAQAHEAMAVYPEAERRFYSTDPRHSSMAGGASRRVPF